MKAKHHFNWAILIAGILFMLGLCGCLAIYNATMLSNMPFYFAGRQLLWLLIGMTALIGCAKIPFEFYCKNIKILAVISVISLLAVLPLGVKINGMSGWYSLGYFWLQPSELSKPIFLLTLCLVSKHFQSGWLRLGAMSALASAWILAVAIQPDFGSVAVYVAGLMIVYWLSDGSIKPLIALMALNVPVVIGVLMLKPYVLRRLKGFWEPWVDPLNNGWHILQFRFAIARGGTTGMSWGKAYWANSYLPLSHSDSVFAALAESLGAAGALPIIGLFVLLMFAFAKMALQTEDGTRQVFVVAIGAVVLVQALIHISVNLTILPPTGLTLPVLSYGGSSLLATMIGAGMAISAATPSRSKRNVLDEIEK